MALVFICISCKKETINFPHSLYHTKTTATTDVRLFINKVEIFDKTIIDNFIKNINIFNRQNIPVNPNEKITFPTKDTIVFESSGVKYNSVLTGNQFIFTSPPYYVTMLTSSPNGMELYPDKVLQLPGISPSYVVNRYSVATGDYNSLYISFFSYLLRKVSPGSGAYLHYYSNAGNVFNQNFINTLGLSDTLAIQEFRANYEAR